MSYYRDYLKRPLVLIGAGGIGSNLAPLLAKVGAPHLTIWDDDTVEPVNLAMQHFAPGDIGRFKAEVVAQRVRELRPEMGVSVHTRRFVQEDDVDGIVISAVDSMQSRRAVFEAVLRARSRVPLLIDGRFDRQYNEFIDVYATDPSVAWEVELYRGWFFDDAEASKAPRPEKLSAHTPYLLAGLVGQILARWVEGGRRPVKATLDATTCTMVVHRWNK